MAKSRVKDKVTEELSNGIEALHARKTALSRMRSRHREEERKLDAEVKALELIVQGLRIAREELTVRAA